MTKHTPGPWRVSKQNPRIIKKDYTHIGLSEDAGVLIGSACGHPNSGFYPTDEEGEANARLMASAPDLLAFLQGAANYIDRLGGDSKEYRIAITKATEE